MLGGTGDMFRDGKIRFLFLWRLGGSSLPHRLVFVMILTLLVVCLNLVSALNCDNGDRYVDLRVLKVHRQQSLSDVVLKETSL